MNKIHHHFRFRVQQSLRLFNLNPRVSLPAVLVSVAFTLIELPEEEYYSLLFFILTFIFHLNRKDIPFLKKVFTNNWRLVIFLESAFVYGVFLLINIHYRFEKIGFIFFAALISFCFIKPQSKLSIHFKWDFISDNLFEWKSYLRKNTWFFIFVYITIILSAYHQASLILCGIILLDFISHVYENNENKEMLEVFFRKNSFKDKMYKNIIFFNTLLLPTYIGFLILNSAASQYLIYYMFFMNLYFLLILTRKYKMYNHREKTNYFSIMVFIEYFFCSMTIIPAFFIIHQNVQKARQNINGYVGN